MAVHVIFNHAGNRPDASNFFLTRQPILDRSRELVAFELMFREANNTTGEESADTAISVLTHFAELTMLKTLGELRGFVHVDTEVLMSEIFQHIPRTKFILTLKENIEPTDAIIQRVTELAASGFVFALDEVLSNSESVQKFLPLVEIVSFDLHKVPLEALAQLTPQVHFANKKLWVENVETLAQFETCLALGFDYFQGYYFAKPVIAPEKKLAPSQMAVVELIGLISSDAESGQIEVCIKRDVSIGLNLLRLVNSAAVGMHRIDSLKQALMVLGRNQLLSLLQVMLYTQPRENSPSIKPLLSMATTRGKLLELLAQRHRPGNRGIADTAFTVGIMSLMDTLFSLPMADILKQIAVTEEVSGALLLRQGYYGDLLKLAEATEHATDTNSLQQMLQKFHLTSDDLYWIQCETFEWSNSIAQAMHA